MKKTILKSALAALIVAVPAIVAAQGLEGNCYDCHTMHNSENGLPVAIVDGATSADPIQNLLRLDCIACHADPTRTTHEWGGTSGTSVIPQVNHQGATDLAGGNFYYGIGDSSKVHNVVDLFAGQWDTNGGDTSTTAEFGAPPGTAPAPHYHGLTRQVFTTDLATPFDAFTCAGARGCHGTRAQVLYEDNSGGGNTATLVRRTGIAAISGSHHKNIEGDKSAAANYVEANADHDGDVVVNGYRFIPGLKGWGNETTRWQNVSSASHNEYYGDNDGAFGGGENIDGGTDPSAPGCSLCHISRTTGTIGGNFGSTDSGMRVPGNSMSGFCATCHGKFHSSGAGGDYVDNGVSSAFLRHPSDYVIPSTGEYAGYTAYSITAPVARPTLTASSATVAPGTDMVMCLSCHLAHGSAYDYILRFDYTGQIAGTGTGDLGEGCLACHTAKGTVPVSLPTP